jgi:predicted CoA-binding protein
VPPGAEQMLVIRRMLDAQHIAVVGLSTNEHKPSFRVAKYLKERGKTIIPVNPNHESVFGLKSYGSLEQVPGEIEVVNVFRRAEFCADVVRAAIKRGGVKGIWLQQGIRCEEAKELACNAGIDFIQDRCIMVEHQSAL